MTKMPWGAVDARRGEQVLLGRERLAALLLWLRNEPRPGITFHHAEQAAPIDDPATVNWHMFPLQEAMDATADGDGADTERA